MRKSKSAADFSKARAALVRNLCRNAVKRGEEVIERVIPFTNDDVPRFLEELDRFEKESAKSRIVAKKATLLRT